MSTRIGHEDKEEAGWHEKMLEMVRNYDDVKKELAELKKKVEDTSK